MKQKNKQTLTPKLRFPEFWEVPGWEEKKLGTVGFFTGGGTPSKDKEHYWTGGIPWISSSDLSEDSIFHINISRFITEDAIRESATKLVPANSILLISRVGVGKLAISTTQLCTSQDFTNFTPTESNIFFLAYMLKSRKNTLLSFNQGTSIKGFTKDDIASLNMGFPFEAEQQKIASCLSSLDGLIAAEGRMLEALKAHKKGLMQQFFPQPGQTQPRLRFPEFVGAGEWEEKALREIGEIVTGKTPSTKEADLWGGSILFITPTDISGECKYQSHTQRTIVKTVGTKVLPVGSVVYTCIASIGKMAITVHPSTTNQQINSVIPKVGMDTDYIYYALAHLTPWIKSIPATSTLPIINKSEFSAITIKIPKNSAEQHRIADCLTSLDTRITAQATKIDALKQHKRGLMQQLFPAPEEG